MPEKRIRLLYRITWVLAVMGAVLVAFQAALDSPLVDGFHEGEYLASRFYFDRPGPAPVMIHGMMDVIPARLAQALFGPERMIAGTRLMNALASALAALLFLFGMARTARSRAGQTASLLVAIGALLLIARVHWGVVDTQQGAPAVRELALLAVLCLLIEAGRARGRQQAWLSSLAGLLTGLTMFWAYNRGVAAVAALGAWCGCHVVLARSLRPVLPAMAGLAAGLLLNMVVGGFAGHLYSIVYWQANGDIWHRIFPSPVNRNLLILCFVTVGYPAVFGLVELFRGWRRPGGGEPDVILALAAAAGVTLLSSLNRFDYLHANMVLPFALMAVAAVVAVLARRFPAELAIPDPAIFAAVILLVAALLSVQARRVEPDLAANLKLLTRATLPRDVDLALPSDLAVARELRASPSSCAYAMDNQSAFLHLAGKPACSRFMIPIYAGRAAQAQLLADLQRTRPAVIVLRSQAWSWMVDDVPQDRRTPAIFAWLHANYEPAEVIGGVQLARAKSDRPRPAL